MPSVVDLARAGHSVVPLRPGTKAPAKEHLPGGKVNPLKSRPLTASHVQDLARRYPGLGWGILLDGRFCVLDFDAPEAWQTRDRPVPFTPMVETGRGYQMWFSPVREVRRNTRLATGLELKVNGYVPVPGTTHHSGRVYSWMPGLALGEVPLSPLPGWVLPLCSEPPQERPVQVSPIRDTRSTPPLSTGLWEMLNSPEVAKGLLARRGVSYQEGAGFRCILPGHDERIPSASVWRSPSGELVYRDFHARHGRAAYRLTDVYYALQTGTVRVLGRGEQVVWGIRMLADLRLLALPDMNLPDPEDVTAAVQRVWRGILLLLQCRKVYSPAPALPLSWRFVAEWSGVAQETAGRAVQTLLRKGYLRLASTAQTKLALFQVMAHLGRKPPLGDTAWPETVLEWQARKPLFDFVTADLYSLASGLSNLSLAEAAILAYRPR